MRILPPRFLSWVVPLLVLPWLAAGCGGDTPPKAATFANLQPIFTRACTFSSCHGNGGNMGNLSLGTGAYCNLTGATAGLTFRDTAKGQFPHRVVAGDRAHSFLYKKLTLSDAESGTDTALGMRMPFGNPPLGADEIDLFGRWIDAGAPSDPGTDPCH